MKKFMDDPGSAVVQSLVAFAEVHADLVRADGRHRLCLRSRPLPRGHVALVSGGGAGHEPLHLGFVGDGMLAAAVSGEIFVSPSSEQIVAAARAVEAGGGVLFLVKNYSGDVLNFRLARADLAAEDDVQTAMVVVGDDASAPRGSDGPGRRGVAGTLLVEKIAGAAAAEGRSLAEVVAIAEQAAGAVSTLGVALRACTTPMAGRPTFELGEEEVEFGVGIHGERGHRREPWGAAAALAERLVDQLAGDLSIGDGARVLVFTNGLGAVPEGELYLLHGDVLDALRRRGIRAERHLVGNYVTSLDMYGASVSLLVLDDALRRLWDAPAVTPSLVKG